MAEIVAVYDCGCCDGPEGFYLCRKAQRLDDRTLKAALDLQGYYSLASDLAKYPITWTDPRYFERRHSIEEDAQKLFATASELQSLARESKVAGHREYRARRAIAEHLRKQSADGAYREEVIEAPPEPDFDQADLY